MDSVQHIDEKIEDNNRKVRCAEEAIDRTDHIHRDTKDILEELASCWKGETANRLISEAYDANESDFREMMHMLDERQESLHKEKESLLLQEDDLRRQNADEARNEDESRESLWD
jgi:hypothetical protein